MIKKKQHPDWCAMFGLQHGFYTRLGGVSKGVYHGLNCGLLSGDTPEHVRQNWALVADDLGIEQTTHLLGVKQVHGTQVLMIRHQSALHDLDQCPEADALVTNLAGVGLAVVTADCAPVLFVDPQAGVIGATHAGWKGALNGVLENTIAAMEMLGAERACISVLLGPCIAQQSYQVDAAYRERFIAHDQHNHAYFYPSAHGNPHETLYQFDFQAYVLQRLRQNQLASVQQVAGDTYANESEFFSYRRCTHRCQRNCGRQISCIVRC